MLIVFLECCLLFLLIRKLLKRSVNLQPRLLVTALFLQVIILIVYRLELASLGREVYYSDAEVYWNETLQLLHGEKLFGTQVGYAYWSYIIQKFSLFRWVGFNNVSNVLLIDISIVALALSMSTRNTPTRNIRNFLLITLYNPLVIYSLLRNLKDALFLTLTIMIILLYSSTKKHLLIRLLLISLLSFAISTVRPWGFLVFPISLFANQLLSIIRSKNIKELSKKASITILGTATILLIIWASGLWGHIRVWMPEILKSFRQSNISKLLASPFTLLTGPGFYRALNGSTYFMFYTNSGNIFTAIGAAVWWFNLSFFLTCVQIKKGSFTTLGTSILACLLFFIILYSVQYGGSVELRFRGILYILLSASLFSIFKFREEGNSLRIALGAVPIFIIGTYMSM